MGLLEGLVVYVLILVWAALLGWLPFRLLERISIVDQLDISSVRSARHGPSSRVTCHRCGHPNDTGYCYCARCGGKIFTGSE